MPPDETQNDLLQEALFVRHGPLMGGEVLANALGYRNQASFRQARRRGQLSVAVFKIPNRKGYFALTLEVADWLARLRLTENSEEK